MNKIKIITEVSLQRKSRVPKEQVLIVCNPYIKCTHLVGQHRSGGSPPKIFSHIVAILHCQNFDHRLKTSAYHRSTSILLPRTGFLLSL
jgi:hypothetical protein